MTPGPKLDALVAEKVMGLVIPSRPGWGPKPYSTDIAAAWEVVEKFGHFHIQTVFGDGSVDSFGEMIRVRLTTEATLQGRTMESIAETAPHAICLAALKAVGYTLPTAE
jgi:hypothetical protein